MTDAKIQLFVKSISNSATVSVTVQETSNILEFYKSVSDVIKWKEDSFILCFLGKMLLNPHMLIKDTGVSNESTLFILSMSRKWDTEEEKFKAVDDCLVCFEKTLLDDGAMFIPCLHGFMKERICLNCALSVRRNSGICPLCCRNISHVFVKRETEVDAKRKWTKIE